MVKAGGIFPQAYLHRQLYPTLCTNVEQDGSDTAVAVVPLLLHSFLCAIILILMVTRGFCEFSRGIDIRFWEGIFFKIQIKKTKQKALLVLSDSSLLFQYCIPKAFSQHKQ